MKNILGGVLFFIAAIGVANSQITLSNSAINNYVANICGPGITFSNATLTGDPDQIALFTGGTAGGIGANMNSGIVMSTGSVIGTELNGPYTNGASTAVGTVGIPELDGIAGAGTFDGIMLEFDFIPITNSINVNYVFGSEEYNEYVFGGYNDAFAFYISGPGIGGSVNIATVPSTILPVTIDNINAGTSAGCGTGCTNCSYYNDNCNGTFNNSMDGFTTQLTAIQAVIPCSTYRIRLMLADGGDSSLDSWVFIQENGLFASGAPLVTSSPTFAFGTNAFEDCSNSSMVFSIPTALATPYTFSVVWSGTATSGVDYVALPTSITIPAGSTTYTLPIDVLTDGITEGVETLICTFSSSVCSTSNATIQIFDSFPFTLDVSPNQTICSGSSANISSSVANPNGAVTYLWSTGATTSSLNVSPSTTTTYTLTATDACGRVATDNITVTVIAQPTSTFTLPSPVCAGDIVNVTYTGTAPAGSTYNWSFPGGSIVSGSGAGPLQVTYNTGGFYNATLQVVNGSCSSSTTLPIQVNNLPIVDAGNPLTVCENTGITVSDSIVPNMTGSWSHGIIPGVPFTPPVGVNWYYYTGTVTSTGCSATDSVSITVNANPVIDAGPDIVVCQGTPVTFNASGGVNYFWPNPIVNGVPVLLAPSNYSITMYGEDANGCLDTSLILLSVIPTPATPILNSNGPVCVGQTLNLTSNAATGSILWTGPNGFTSNLQNPSIPNVSLAAAGTYTAYRIISGCTSAIASLNVVINPAPAAPVLASNSPVCTGATINLTSNTATGNIWSGPNGFSSTLQNPSIANVTTAASGTYSAYVVALGCTSATATVNVVVNPTPATPVLASNTPLCSGATLNLSSDVTAGNNWTGPNGFTSSLQNPSITNVTTAASGTYSAYVVALGCTSATATVNVVVNPTPAAPVLASNSPVCTGATINLTSNTATGNNWSGPNGFTSTLQNPNITNASLTESGTYSGYVVALGCTSLTSTINVTVTTTPPGPALTSNTPLCSGQTLTLGSDATVGNNWTGPNGFASNVQNPTVTNATTLASGVYSVYVVVNGCTSATSTMNVLVNATPAAPIVNVNTPICAGASLNFSSNVTAGNNWTGPNGFTSTLQNPTINNATVAASGTYSAYAVALGCTSATATVNAVVNPIPATPVLASNSPICAGSSLNLTSDATAGNNWTGPNGFNSTLQNPTINNATVAASGTYSAYAVALGCSSATATVNAVVNPIPAIPVLAVNSPICAGSSLNLTSDATSGNNWTGPNGFTSTLQNPTINNATVAASGTYSAYAVALGCTSATATVNAVVNPIPATPVLASNSPICAGSSLNLTSDATAGNNWTGPNGFNSTLQNPTINNATVAASGTYSAYAVALGCTSATATVNVVVNPIPAIPVLASNSPICAGSSLNLTSDATSGNNWTGPNGFSSTIQNPTINNATVAASGTYSAYAVALGCTSATATVNAVVNPIPATPVLAVNSPICSGASLNLTSNATAGNNWTGPNGFTSTLQNPTINNTTVAENGTYSAYVVALGCSSATATVNAVVNQTPATPNLTTNGPLCEGQLVNLTSDVPGNVFWTGPNGFTSLVQNPAIANADLNMNGVYNAYVEVNGCTSVTANVNLVVNSNPAAVTASNNGPICTGTTLQLNATTLNGVSYVWTGPNNYTSTIEDNQIPNAQANHSGVYSVFVMVNGCSSAVSNTTVNVQDIPTLDPITSNGPLCEGASLQLNASAYPNVTYVWTGPNGYTSNFPNPVINPVTLNNTGAYNLYLVMGVCTSTTQTTNVIVNPNSQLNINHSMCAGDKYEFAGNQYGVTGNYTIVLQNQFGCDSVVILNLTVNPNPEADFSAPLNVSLGDPLMNVYDNSYNATSVSYQFNGGVINQPNWEFIFQNEGVYLITQFVSNGLCTDSLTKEVYVNPYTNIFIPNTFTVNDDNLNDEFKVIGSFIETFEIHIFDRWGQIVYKSDNIYEGWNGGFHNNIDKIVKQDTYVYKIKYKEFKGENKQLIGHVNLIR